MQLQPKCTAQNALATFGGDQNAKEQQQQATSLLVIYNESIILSGLVWLLACSTEMQVLHMVICILSMEMNSHQKCSVETQPDSRCEMQSV